LEVWVDLGYQGIQSDYQGAMIEIPHKKPRKSQANPAPEFRSRFKIITPVVSARDESH
jgi:hypothetical protein